jgi:signal transduction histidine kinase
VKSRSLGLIFIAAVIVPSILLAVLSIRAAGREEAFVEKQLATPLDVETSHAAALANAEIGRIVEELKAGIDIPAGGAYLRLLSQWKAASPLVSVPFLLSPRYGILWPAAPGADQLERRFLQENGDFLNDKATTTVLQNIAERYKQEILAQSAVSTPRPAAETGAAVAQAADVSPETASPAAGAGAALGARSTGPAEPSALAEEAVSKDQARAASSGQGGAAAPQAASDEQAPPESTTRQKALDAFAQSPAIQTEVYQAAAEKGDQLSARVVQPLSKSASNAPAPVVTIPAPADVTAASPTASPLASPAPSAAGASSVAGSPSAVTSPADNEAAARARKQAPAVVRQEQPSQYVVTSQLLSQIASAGDSGIIPRFTNSGLVFLFWKRQADGRIAGCEITVSLLRQRVAGVLGQTATESRILTILDENGAPLAAPPGEASRDWRRPFVSREIGPSLPRWEAAAYLTNPDAIASQARSTSLVIWIMVLILFISVAGGGTMVLSSVYGEMRLAQKKATFVTNVSHELKTPLTSISLFIELLRGKRPVSAEKRESYLSQMASETERLTRLINNVLDFSAATARTGRKRYAMETIDAGAVTEQIVESQRVRLESRGFSLSLSHPAGETPVRADGEALKQVLLNILANAEKYSPGRKEIEVTVESAADNVLVHVLDRGIGIAENDRERIFREFFRVDDSLSSRVQGTGLGLTIARRIARDHGGEVTCLPRDGGGSDFVVRLPRREPGYGPLNGAGEEI